jgi:hypothetical protein
VREELGKLPGAEVELMRGLAGAGVQRSGRSTVEQKARCGGARRATALELGGGCGVAR